MNNTSHTHVSHGMQEYEKYTPEYGMKFNETNSVLLKFKGYRFKANSSAKLFPYETDMSYKYLVHIIYNNLDKKASKGSSEISIENRTCCWQDLVRVHML